MSENIALSDLRPRLIYLVNNINLLTRKSLDERLKAHQLGGLQYTILTLVRDREGISSAELSRRFFVTPQTMNESVTALERRGLITRSESEANKRILCARITDEGRALLTQCDAIANEVEAEVFGSVSPADMKVLHRILRDQLHRLMQQV
ncbi:MarR family winged helix-turn-helix transcriptional regulator [Pararhodobacter sp.]|uniref:MarR family winged helix-turn-helix transcriptional regulator n=1 Tax=Pararhodobacter sp. TaxID=2127056 RepID=UPI002FE146D2